MEVDGRLVVWMNVCLLDIVRVSNIRSDVEVREDGRSPSKGGRVATPTPTPL